MSELDGMLMSDASGRLVRAFEPRWWQVWRWLWFWWPGRERGRVQLTPDAGERGTGRQVRVVVEQRVRLPSVPSTGAIVIRIGDGGCPVCGAAADEHCDAGLHG